MLILFNGFLDVLFVIFSLISDKYNPMRDILNLIYQLGKNSNSFDQYIPTLIILSPDESLYRFPNDMTFLSYKIDKLCRIILYQLHLLRHRHFIKLAKKEQIWQRFRAQNILQRCTDAIR